MVFNGSLVEVTAAKVKVCIRFLELSMLFYTFRCLKIMKASAYQREAHGVVGA